MSTCALLRAYRREFTSIGTFVALLFVVRRGRDVLLPLAGLALGLDVAEIAAVSSTTFFTGACMFPVSGYIMDNFGRKRNAALCLCIMGCGFLVLVFARGSAALFAAAATLGVGNGLSSGLVMTLTADAAPAGVNRGPFLGLIRFLGDTGVIVGPLIVGVVADLRSIAAAAAVMAASAGVCLLWLLLMVRETLAADGDSNDDADVEQQQQQQQQQPLPLGVKAAAPTK